MEKITTSEGLIYDMQRYSIHDGPGIRTIVFLKGCPLRCKWCSNPESQVMEIEDMKNKTIGKYMTVAEIIKKVKRDKVFYDRSGGGITISGGEPLMQFEFTKTIVEICKEEGINVGIETCGYQNWEIAKEIFEKVDFILYDIKSMDTNMHKEGTGVGNELILSNLEKLSQMGKEIVVRIPVIPEFNDSLENIEKIIVFCKDNNIKSVNLLPYHRLGMNKYNDLGREYLLKNILPLPREGYYRLAEMLSEKYRVEVRCI